MGRQRGRYDWLGAGPPGGGGDPSGAPIDEAEAERGAGERGEYAAGGRDDGLEGAEGGAFSGPRPGRHVALGAGVGPGRAGRRRRRRNPNALRNDPNRKVIGAYVRKDVKREVDRALGDERIFPDGDGSLSLLVEGLLERWLEENGYGEWGDRGAGRGDGRT